MSEIVDAEVVGTDVAVVEQPSANLFRTDDPAEVVVRATKVADALKGVLKSQGMIHNIQGKEHVAVEGWTTLGSMLGVTAVVTHTEPVDGGFKATVEARTLDGRVIGAADAICTKHERRGPWRSADDYARLSMAQTRATSKALKGPLGFVVRLAGFEATPAEEMTFAADETVDRVAASLGAVEVISEQRFEELRELARSKSTTVGNLKLALASVGVSVSKDAKAPGVQEAMRSMTPAQADQFAARLAA